MQILLTVIAARYRAVAALQGIPRRYTLRVVTSAFIGHRTVLSGEGRQNVNVNFLKVSTKKTRKIFFNTTFIVLFQNYLTKVSHSTLTALFAELKIKFLSSNTGVGISIARYSSLQHALNVSFWK